MVYHDEISTKTTRPEMSDIISSPEEKYQNVRKIN